MSRLGVLKAAVISGPIRKQANGADAVLRALESEGVDVCFGMPGGAILPLYDALARGTTIRHILVRHEQGAGHMAQGYARASGRPGVVFATSGPGATNLVTPIADAQMDSTPLVCITGQVRRELLGTDAFQECDIIGITLPVVKHSWLVQDVSELPGIVRTACRLATSGRPGPVLIDIPRDVQEAICPVMGDDRVPDVYPLGSIVLSGELDALEAAARAIAAARAPVLYLGGGGQGVDDAVRRFVDRADIPVVTTLMGKGAFPESHPRFVGAPGMHGCRAANLALHHADLIVAAGARFDDRVTGRVDAFAPDAAVIHIDIDPYEHHKIRAAEIAVHGSLGEVLDALTSRLVAGPEQSAWHKRLDSWAARYPLAHPDSTHRLQAQDVIKRMSAALQTRDDVVWTTGVGQHQMWAMQHVSVNRPRSFITSGGHGTMGFGLPAAIGARAARPEATVVCVDGDGSFQMTLQELATAVSANLSVVVVILNNGHLGMVHQWQTMFYEERLSQVDLTAAAPDFAAIARGYGALGLRACTLTEFDDAFATAVASGCTAVIDVAVDPDEKLFPMIVPGGAAAEQVEWGGP